MKKVLMGLVISLLVVSFLLVASHLPIRAQDEDYEAEISKKLDDILRNQKEMLGGIATIKDELNVIKIRVTR